MKKVILIFTVLFSVVTTMQAQTPVEKNERPKRVYNGPTGNAIGMVLSSTNGKGLGYRYWKEKVGVHATFFPASGNSTKYYNGGVTGYLGLRDYAFGTLFLHAGFEYQYMSDRSYYSVYNGNTYLSKEYTKSADCINIGVGPGVHLKGKYVSMDIYAGYGSYTKNWKSSDPAAADPEDTSVMTLTGGVALWFEL